MNAHALPPRIIRYGPGAAARNAATRHADALWARGVAARAIFRPAYGGWAVVIFGIRAPRRA
ncbi:hypothetical protein [Streptomyces noursei]|uniref:hypothetical protein n=1 Tax=Streptomyces noursei TaxID=1971 RepID=UPI0005CB17DA|nr:hypothetical protein [Streptomyces noursei]